MDFAIPVLQCYAEPRTPLFPETMAHVEIILHEKAQVVIGEARLIKSSRVQNRARTKGSGCREPQAARLLRSASAKSPFAVTQLNMTIRRACPRVSLPSHEGVRRHQPTVEQLPLSPQALG